MAIQHDMWQDWNNKHACLFGHRWLRKIERHHLLVRIRDLSFVCRKFKQQNQNNQFKGSHARISKTKIPKKQSIEKQTILTKILHKSVMFLAWLTALQYEYRDTKRFGMMKASWQKEKEHYHWQACHMLVMMNMACLLIKHHTCHGVSMLPTTWRVLKHAKYVSAWFQHMAHTHVHTFSVPVRWS